MTTTRTWCRWTTDDDARLRALVAEGMTEREIAIKLDRTVGAVGERKATLGLSVPKELPWTADEEYRLMEMMEAHHGHDAIARALGRTRGAVFARAARLRVSLRNANGESATRVAWRLGVDSHTVAWWINEGWLCAHDTGVQMGKGPLRIVEHDDLAAFLADERFWHLVEPSRFRDVGLREFAEELRGDVVFLTTRQVADRLCCTHERINQLIHQGTIVARKRGPNWVVKETDVPPTPSGERATGFHKRLWTDDERAILRAGWRVGNTRALARRLGRNDGSVCSQAYRMGLPRLGRGRYRVVGSVAA